MVERSSTLTVPRFLWTLDRSSWTGCGDMVWPPGRTPRPTSPLFTHGGFQGRCFGWVSCLLYKPVPISPSAPEGDFPVGGGRFSDGFTRELVQVKRDRGTKPKFAFYWSARIAWGLSCGEHRAPCGIGFEDVGSFLQPDLFLVLLRFQPEPCPN